MLCRSGADEYNFVVVVVVCVCVCVRVVSIVPCEKFIFCCIVFFVEKFFFETDTCLCLTGLRLLSGRELAVLLCSGGGDSDDALAMRVDFIGEWPSAQVRTLVTSHH